MSITEKIIKLIKDQANSKNGANLEFKNVLKGSLGREGAAQLVKRAPLNVILNASSGENVSKNVTLDIVKRVTKNSSEEAVLRILQGELGIEAAEQLVKTGPIPLLLTAGEQLPGPIAAGIARRVSTDGPQEAVLKILKGELGPIAKNEMTSNIFSRFASNMRKLAQAPVGARIRAIGDLLRKLPKSFKGREDVVKLLLIEIRRARTPQNLIFIKTNLGKTNNSMINYAFESQKRLLKTPNYSFLGNPRAPPLNFRFLGNAFKPKAAPSANYGFIGKPRAPPLNFRFLGNPRAPPPNFRFLGNAFKPRAPPPNFRFLGNAFKPKAAPSANYGFLGKPQAPPPLPSNVKPLPSNTKIPGGNSNKPIVAALQTVPGGLPELAIAAEALNETAGNIQEAKIKGATPEGIQAVKKLGGHKKTISLLNKPSIRNGALNNFLNSVKKQKLISIIAHKITKTNNIHPNDEHLKSYYKKIAKSYIKKTPFANVVRRAAKKNVV